jgi:geranylgeranyl pyrophosphate synthase
VERRLPALLPHEEERPESVHRAMRYAALGAGKRVRPILTLAVAEMFGAGDDAVVDLAAAVELVHACSLVLDDLPAMDDAELRRGRPTTHREFGEDVALLAAAELGAMAADVRRRDFESVGRYAKNLGLAFQIEDDLLDALATPEETGKDVRKDAGKVTFVSLLGVDGARALADELLAFAIESLTPLGRRADALRALAEFVGAPGRR